MFRRIRKKAVRRRLGLLAAVLCSAALTISAALPEALPAAAEGPLIIAHRGASGHAPENTMAAFELAERMEADFIELDVRLSKDGELVVIHDKTVDRITGHTGDVGDYTLEELQGMDSGSYYGQAFAEQKLLSLEDVLTRFYGRIGLLIEVKDPQLYPGIEEKLAEALRRHELLQMIEELGYGAGLGGAAGAPAGLFGAPAGVQEELLARELFMPRESRFRAGVIIQSFNFASMYRVHRLLPDIPVGVLVHADRHPLSDETLAELASFADYINCSYDLLDAALVRRIHEQGGKVMAWTIRKKRDMARMKRLGTDGIITDYPDWR
ncbi:glycerophosphodiester phosphodiesterase [Paenibacillus sp. N4]|uniref:glycerophosphodiester phosphodiesterase n=1 Tax=Paenibacillus vietnamensis TaxID=2590547 RepID=UPI001CD17ACF|nr:glycerophosphodiester phosphodiesterase family protein [Paenibacillus vietnamensis]MCA0757911.1 glycerophosphodiester phosphodiesterase [Paenibacillus vietnamensis]